MQQPSAFPIHDPARLRAVAETGLLDTDPEPAFDDLASLAARLLRAPFAFVTVVDAQRSFWKARIGLEPDGPKHNTVGESFCQYVINSGEPLIAGDTSANPLTADNPSIKAMGVKAWAGFPLLSEESQALGSFCVVDTETREWTDDDVEVLRVLSAAAGREIALRVSAAQAHLAQDQLALLAQVAQALSETLDDDVAVGRLARLVVPVLGDWSLISLVDDAGVLSDVAWWHAREDARPVLDKFAVERLVGLDGAGATYSAQRSRQPVVMTAGAIEAGVSVIKSRQALDAYRELNPSAYGVWPLVSGDVVHGVLVIARDEGHAPFTDDEIELAGIIGQRAGTVLDNARLYKRQRALTEDLFLANERLREAARHDHIVSRALQDAMLTQLPEPDHLHIAARYLTADSHDQVGGDWYDALLPPDGATTLMIGDVAGHDIGAATIMGQLRNLLRALAWEHDSELPSELITRLDRAMTDLSIRTMTTLIVARIEQDVVERTQGLRTLRWSSGGHPSPILIDDAGNARLLPTVPDPPLATVRGAQRRDNTATMRPGETLLLYTDGLIETREQLLEQRQAQLLHVLDTCRGMSLDDLLDTVVHGMVDTQPDDDVALLAVRFHPEDRPRPTDAGPAHA